MAHPIAFTLWDNLFALKLSIGEKLLRPVLVYAFLVVMLRIFGKRELAQLNPFDLVVLLSLSNTVQNAIIGDDNTLLGGLIGAFALLAMNYFVVRFLFRHRKLDEILEGDPTPLIVKGEIDRKNLAKELLSESELITVAHRQGFSDLSEIEEATIEPGGVFYIKSKKPNEDERRQMEILTKIDELMQEVRALRATQQRPT